MNEDMGYMGHEEYGQGLTPRRGASHSHLENGAMGARGGDTYRYISRGGAGEKDRLGNYKSIAMQDPYSGATARIPFLNNENIGSFVNDVPANVHSKGYGSNTTYTVSPKTSSEFNRGPEY